MFKWPIEVERGWFAAPQAIEVAPSAVLTALPAHSFGLSLLAPRAVDFIVPPKRPPADDSGNAVVTLARIPAAATYQVTLSEDAWIEIVQDGKPVPAKEFSGVKGCSGVRKSIRFALALGSAQLQISGAAGKRILVAITRVP